MKSTVYDCVCWLVSRYMKHMQLLRQKMGHKASPLCFGVTPTLCAQTNPETPPEVRGPIRKHMKKLSHSDVTACENLVTIQPVTFNCLSFLFGYFASPIPAERFPLSHYWLRHLQTWQLKNANKREIFALVFGVSTSPSLKRQFPCNTEMFLLLVWVLVVLTLADLIGCLFVPVFHQLMLILLCCDLDKESA